MLYKGFSSVPSVIRAINSLTLSAGLWGLLVFHLFPNFTASAFTNSA